MLLHCIGFGSIQKPMSNIVEPFAPRATVSEDLEGLRIAIPGKFHSGLLFIAVWLCIWTFVGIQAGRSIVHNFSLFICVWLLGWAFGEFFGAYSILYAIGGGEVVVAGSETLTRKIELFGVGRAKSYLVREMSNLRFQPATVAGRSRVASGIAFDYGARTVRVARGVGEAEANDLISRIRQRCNILSTTAPQEAGTKFWQG